MVCRTAANAAPYDCRMVAPTDRISTAGTLVEEALYLESLLQDLAFARRALDAMGTRKVAPIASQPIEDLDVVLVALWHAAASAYARCFSQGARKGLADKIKPTDEAHLQAHREVTNMRGDHIGHLKRDSEHERLRGEIVLGETTDDHLAARFELEGNKTMLPSASDVRRYKALIADVTERVESLRADVHARIGDALNTIGGESLQAAAREGRTIRLDS